MKPYGPPPRAGDGSGIATAARGHRRQGLVAGGTTLGRPGRPAAASDRVDVPRRGEQSGVGLEQQSPARFLWTSLLRRDWPTTGDGSRFVKSCEMLKVGRNQVFKKL